MAATDRLRKRLADRFDRYREKINWYQGVTGNNAGIISVPDRPGFVFVRDMQGYVHEAYNNVVPVDKEYVVRVGYDEFNHTLQTVLGHSNPYQQTTYRQIPSHHETHEWPAEDTVWVKSQQIFPGLVAPTTGLTVCIQPFCCGQDDGTFIIVPYQTLDLTSHIPSSGARWVTISINSSGAAVATDGSTVTALSLLASQAIPAPTDRSQRAIAAVAMYLGQTEITQNAAVQLIADLRFGSGQGSTRYILHSLATAANDFLVASGVGVFVKKTLAETVTILRTSLDSVYAALVHATRHQSGGADAIKLDDLAAPDDNTDLNATTSVHGLMSKADKSKLDGLGGSGFTWSVITADQSAAVNNGYICNKGTLLVLTLPTTAAVGSTIRVAGMNTGLWKIAQPNSGSKIHFGSRVTTTGTGGYLESTNRNDAIELVCIVANDEWTAISSVGNITIV